MCICVYTLHTQQSLIFMLFGYTHCCCIDIVYIIMYATPHIYLYISMYPFPVQKSILCVKRSYLS